ncbi:MAG: SWIM zinc finger domain-containing protein [Paenibacillus lautus]|uniref:SWIM zinc finger family protein n=1 Tax=Paenibacillus lautus TaxID=1401 RepID=UPI0026EB6C78|nr:SWIM zinc finger family protein [Paenibacillus lautus]MCI1775676.1 SWIM zinc finger domain-containing protein [Paenibacillus lautus]
MVEITETWIDSQAPNSAAIKNGQGLVKKGRFLKLHHSEDQAVLFGTCAGSGSSDYQPSADFAVPEKPVMRCTCPSRQFPCKHVLGLLYAYAAGASFTPAEVPEDLAAKREKAEKREERKLKEVAEGAAPKPKKVNKSALKKKLQAQLEGLDVLEKLIHSLIRNGLGTLDKKEHKRIQEHVKQMGNYYLSGAQTELRRLALVLSSEDQEKAYTYAVGQLAVMNAMIKKGRQYLTTKLEDPDMRLDHESTIEEWLGHAWQLTELQSYGLVSKGAELVQLSFLSYADDARLEHVDTGYWIQKDSGEIHRTIQYRPYKAAKLMREEDSFFDKAHVPVLYRYPGDMNRRVRFEEMTSSPVTEEDLAWIRNHAAGSYAEAVKNVKNQLKNPLSDSNPVMLLHVSGIGRNAEGQYAITDESGQSIGLADVYMEPTVPMLRYLPEEKLSGVSMLVMFEHSLETGRLLAQPLSIITTNEIIRLLY